LLKKERIGTGNYYINETYMTIF